MAEKLSFLASFGLQPKAERHQFYSQQPFTAAMYDSREDIESIASVSTTSTTQSIRVKRALLCRIPFHIIAKKKFQATNDLKDGLKQTRYVSFDYEPFCNRAHTETTRPLRKKQTDLSNTTTALIPQSAKKSQQTEKQLITLFYFEALSHRSQELKRLMKPCTVNLANLSQIDFSTLNLSNETRTYLQKLKTHPKKRTLVKNLKQITCKTSKGSINSSKKQSLKSKQRLRRRVKQLSLPTLKTNTVFSNGAALAANPNLALNAKSILPVTASKSPIQKAAKIVLPILKSLQIPISNGHHSTNNAPLNAIASTNNNPKIPLIVKPLQLNNNNNKSVANNIITNSVFKPAVVIKSYENKRIISTNKELVHRNILANGLLKLNLQNTQNIGKQTNTSTNYAKTILFSNVTRKYNQTGSHKPFLSTFSQTSTAMTSQTVEIIDLTADSEDDDDVMTANNFNLNLIRFAKVLKS